MHPRGTPTPLASSSSPSTAPSTSSIRPPDIILDSRPPGLRLAPTWLPLAPTSRIQDNIILSSAISNRPSRSRSPRSSSGRQPAPRRTRRQRLPSRQWHRHLQWSSKCWSRTRRRTIPSTRQEETVVLASRRLRQVGEARGHTRDRPALAGRTPGTARHRAPVTDDLTTGMGTWLHGGPAPHPRTVAAESTSRTATRGPSNRTCSRPTARTHRRPNRRWYPPRINQLPTATRARSRTPTAPARHLPRRPPRFAGQRPSIVAAQGVPMDRNGDCPLQLLASGGFSQCR
jgi:hypothetical protein